MLTAHGHSRTLLRCGRGRWGIVGREHVDPIDDEIGIHPHRHFGDRTGSESVREGRWELEHDLVRTGTAAGGDSGRARNGEQGGGQEAE